jgi:hypothetical protein
MAMRLRGRPPRATCSPGSRRWASSSSGSGSRTYSASSSRSPSGARSCPGRSRTHGLRRLVDHRLQPDRGVGHGGHARPDDVPDPPLADRGVAHGRPPLLRRPQAGRALRGRPPLPEAAGARASEGDGFRPLLPRSRARVLPLQVGRGDGGARQGRLLRPHHARRGVRLPPRLWGQVRLACAALCSIGHRSGARSSAVPRIPRQRSGRDP